MRKFFKGLNGFLCSRDLAIILLIIFTGNAMVNMLGWQDVAPLKETPSLVAGLFTYSFYLSGILLCFNLLACSCQRIRQEIRGQGSLAVSKGEFTAVFADQSGALPKKIHRILTQNGYRKIPHGGGASLYRQGYGGRWGSIAYHLGLLVIVAGIFWLNQTRYEGTLFLAEGQSFTPEGGLIIAKRPEQEFIVDQPFRITLEKFAITYLGDSPVESAAQVLVEEAGQEPRREKIRINYPLQVRGITFMLQDYDYSPRFVFSGEGGQVFFDSYVNLFINQGRQDFFRLPGSPLTVWVKFYPDAELRQGQPVNGSNNPRRPLFWVQLREGERILGEKYLRLKEPWKTSAGILEIADLSAFVHLMVTQEEGAGVLLTGFALTVTGILFRFFLVEKRISLDLTREGRFILAGQAEYYPNIFRENFQELVREIKKEAAGHD